MGEHRRKRTYAPVVATLIAGDALSQAAVDLLAPNTREVRAAVARFAETFQRTVADACVVFGARADVQPFFAEPVASTPLVACVILREDLVPLVAAVKHRTIAAAVGDALVEDPHPGYLPVLVCLATGAALVWLGRSGATAPGGVA